MHAAERLWKEQQKVTSYPACIVAVEEPIRGTAFFPGGYGLWREKGEQLPEFPFGETMILGQDFDSERGYRESLERGSERMTAPTWSNLLPVLRAAGIDPKQCFFTNFYLGLRACEKNTGPFPGRRNRNFVECCCKILRTQISEQKPKRIITLGASVPRLIAALSPELARWKVAHSLLAVDEYGPVQHAVTFNGIDNFQTTVIALTHPSLRNLNVKRRRYRGRCGSEAEIMMLHDSD